MSDDKYDRQEVEAVHDRVGDDDDSPSGTIEIENLWSKCKFYVNLEAGDL